MKVLSRNWFSTNWFSSEWYPIGKVLTSGITLVNTGSFRENWGLIPTQHEKKNPVDKKSRDGKLEPIHKKYKANKSMRTHVMKEHNNQDTTNM
jgi:hypothetical protein